MLVRRQFEKRGPLWLPKYTPDFSRPAWGGADMDFNVCATRPVPRPRRSSPGEGDQERGLPRFERYRRRFRCSWTQVNGTTYEGSATSHAISLGFTPSAGSLLVVAAGFEGSGTLSISDNSSGPADSWTALFSSQQTWASVYTFQAWATNITTGTAPTSVTVSTSGSANYWLVVIDNYTGGPNPFVLDGAAQFGSGSGSVTSLSVNFTTGSQTGDLLWSALLLDGSNSSEPTVGSPFSIEVVKTSGYNICSAAAGISSSLSASTQYTASWSWGTSQHACSCVVGFKALAAFQPDEDYWQGPMPSAPDNPVTVFS